MTVIPVQAETQLDLACPVKVELATLANGWPVDMRVRLRNDCPFSLNLVIFFIMKTHERTNLGLRVTEKINDPMQGEK